jgi:secreted PhoX family phosphatase
VERPDHGLPDPGLMDDDATVNPSANPTFQAILAARMSRRGFLAGSAAGLAALAMGRVGPRGAEAQAPLPFTPVVGSTEDKLILPPGYTHSVLVRWGDPIFPGAPEFAPQAQTAAKQERQFGSDNDFIGFMPLPRGSNSSTRGLLGVNHENVRPELTWPTWDGKAERTKEMCDVEVAAHGFSVIEIVRSDRGEWSVVKDSSLNRRITGATPMAIQGPAAGHALMRTGADPSGRRVLGTLNNCAGGVTPWGTILTGEENIQNYFRGKIDAGAAPAAAKRLQRYGIAGRGRYMSWGLHDARFDLEKEPNEPNRFGWIVEIDPYEPASVPIKHTALGRFAHEGATVILAKDGRPIAYTGDDARFEYLYKFVAAGRYDPANRTAATSLLDSGTLYAAKLNDDGTGEWLPLVHGQGPLTEANGFPSQAEVVINARGAGDLVGATKMDRPEDVEPSPVTGKVYAALTSNDARKPEQVNKANPRPANKFGHILEIIEDGGDHTSTRFRWEILLLGGNPKDPSHSAYYQGHTDVSPVSVPDNFAFDDQGRLWVATDGMDDTLGPNDAVFLVDTEGPLRGRALQFLSAPTGAEVCGPAFTPDNRTFFVAMQHPGLTDKATYAAPGSRWPDQRPDMPPRPSVVAIYRTDGGKVGG